MPKKFIDINLSPEEIRKGLKQIKNWEVKKKGQAVQAVASSALAIQREAKRAAPVDTGRLRAGIVPEFSPSGLTAKIFVRNVVYAPYREFGTGSKVEIPKGYEAFAAQFKGKGVRQVDSKAQPHLIPAFENEQPKFIKKIKKILHLK